jgi:hypothetical protein
MSQILSSHILFQNLRNCCFTAKAHMVIKVVVVVSWALLWSHVFCCLVLGTLFLVPVKDMLLVVMNIEYGWLWHNAKPGNSMKVVLDMCLGPLVVKKAIGMMADVMAANALFD